MIILFLSTSEMQLTYFQQNTGLKMTLSICAESRGDEFQKKSKSNTQSSPMVKKCSDRQMVYKEVLS